MQFIENEICEYTENIWKSTLALEAKPTQDEYNPGKQKDFLAGCVQITGSWEGTVAIHCPMSLARQVAAIMFSLEENSIDKEQIQDALGELANMTGGNIKSLLPEPCYLSLPAVALTSSALRIPGSELLTKVTFECNGNHFLVSLLKRIEADGDGTESTEEAP
ncbi:MAG: chemotaxis protein CheX [Nitrospinaceae bacterium]